MATDTLKAGSARSRGAKIPRRSRVGYGLVALRAIVGRDISRALRNFPAVIVDIAIPALILIVFAAGFARLPRALTEPYGFFVSFSEYLVPGAVGLVLLLSGARAAVALVRDHGGESIRFLLAAPLPRWFVVSGKLLAAALLATGQAAIFLFVVELAGIHLRLDAWVLALPAVFLASLMVTAVLMAIVVYLRPARDFARLILYAVIPVFVVSTAMHQTWRFVDAEAGYLEVIALANPFTHAVETIRYAAEGQISAVSLAVVIVVDALAFLAVTFGIDPRRGFLAWRRRSSGWGEEID